MIFLRNFLYPVEIMNQIYEKRLVNNPNNIQKSIDHFVGNENRNIFFHSNQNKYHCIRLKREVCSRKCSTFLRFA